MIEWKTEMLMRECAVGKVRKEKKEKRGREFHAASRGPFKKGRENARDKVRNVVNTDGLADTSLPRLLQRPSDASFVSRRHDDASLVASLLPVDPVYSAFSECRNNNLVITTS